MPLCKICDEIYFLPISGNKLFEKVHAFPCKTIAKNEHWEYLVGFRNVDVKTKPNLKLLHVTGS